MASRERVTVLNPLPSHDYLISSVDGYSLSLNQTVLDQGEFLVEHKWRYLDFSHDLLTHIDSLRIHINDASRALPSSFFGVNYQPGLNVYVVPGNVTTTEEKTAFFNNANQLLSHLFGFENVKHDNWIMSYNSVYFYRPQVPSNINWSALSLDELAGDTSPIVDITWAHNQLIAKTLTNQPQLNYEAELDKFKEIGIFHIDRSISEPDDLVLSGARVQLAVPEEDPYFHRTLFHIKPRQRHVPHETNAINYYIEPNGLHPVLKWQLDQPAHLPVDSDIDSQSCKLYNYLTLPKDVFVDKYQIGDNLRLVAILGNNDLELPSYSVNEWGSEVLLEVNDANQPHPLELTLHSRYQLPDNSTAASNATIDIPKPLFFYGCDLNDDQAELLSNSPFDTRFPIGGNYEVYFTNDTVFYHVADSNKVAQHGLQVEVPRGVKADNTNYVYTITLAVVTLGIAIILRKLITGRRSKKVVKSTKKKE